mgnify:FL=1|tara:strand:- start:9000 stop:10244 length:1245 start_codon:yes stop_codon:yes gene_type:complete
MARTPTGLNSLKTTPQPSVVSPSIIPVRVKFVSLNGKDYPINWKEYGEYSGMGGILFEELNNPSGKPLQTLSFALPLYSNIKFLPLINEIVYIISLPDATTQQNISGGKQFYYFQSINIWNSIHHNALPNSLESKDTNSENYSKTESGVELQADSSDNNVNLGITFKERIGIRNLQPYEGDVLIEGRWGNTIRFGSTVNNSTPSNPWSDSGVNGEPIITIKNGQSETEDDPWVPQVENINTDKSSLYLTSNQQIPIGAASTDYSSYTAAFGEIPSSPSLYNGSQVIVNSGRLLFNSKNDHILLSSARTISFGAQKGFNFDTPANFVVKVGTKIMLGDKEESTTEPLILGDKFLADFQKLLTNIISLTSALGTVGTPVPFTPNIAVAQTATKVGLQAQAMLTSIEFYKSKTTRTL